MAEQQEWSNTPSELLVALTQTAPDHFKRQRSWPKRPNILSSKLRRSATFLREKNLEIEWSKSGQRNITIRRVVGDKELPIPPSPPLRETPPQLPPATEMSASASANNEPAYEECLDLSEE